MNTNEYLTRIETTDTSEFSLPVHSLYWSFDKETVRENKVCVSFYNTNNYWTFRFYKPISRLLNLNI